MKTQLQIAKDSNQTKWLIVTPTDKYTEATIDELVKESPEFIQTLQTEISGLYASSKGEKKRTYLGMKLALMDKMTMAYAPKDHVDIMDRLKQQGLVK